MYGEMQQQFSSYRCELKIGEPRDASQLLLTVCVQFHLSCYFGLHVWRTLLGLDGVVTTGDLVCLTASFVFVFAIVAAFGHTWSMKMTRIGFALAANSTLWLSGGSATSTVPGRAIVRASSSLTSAFVSVRSKI